MPNNESTRSSGESNNVIGGLAMPGTCTLCGLVGVRQSALQRGSDSTIQVLTSIYTFAPRGGKGKALTDINLQVKQSLGH